MPIAKQEHHRSPELRRSARGETCTGCGKNDGTTVWCHGNESVFGKGVAIKSHDLIGFYGCADCHFFLDRSRASKEAKREFFREAFVKSMVRVAEKLAKGELRL